MWLYFSKFETSNMIFYWGFEQEVVIGEGSVQEVVVIHLDKWQQNPERTVFRDKMET